MSLGLANAANARDLGGLRTRDGRIIRSGVIFRSGALNRLTETDLIVVDGLGLACLIDFRHEREIAMVGPDLLPERAPGRLVSLPLIGPDGDVFSTVTAAMSGGGALEVLSQLHPDHPSGGGPGAMRSLYRWFAADAGAQQSFAAALRLIATADALPLLFHCTAGKDRTGWLAALVLTILDVDRETIVADYLRTNDLNAASTAYLLSRVAALVPDTSILLPLLDARSEYLEAAFAEVDAVGVASYVSSALGLDDAVVSAIRSNLLSPA